MSSFILDTIVAPATPPGRGGVGIVRISGSNATNIAKKLVGFIPKPRYAKFTPFFHSDGSVIDEGIALFFPAPNSYTGEDVLELQAHGGPIVLDNLIQTVLENGARLAKPGEFSERAFLNGKMDLAQAEAIADLINATSQAAATSALKSMQGVFSEKINTLVDDVTKIRMHIESAIDFPEEEIDFLSDGVIENKLKKIIEKLSEIKQTANQGALLQEGMTLVLVGEPNAGKSSLLNQLSGKESAIVTDIAGTTRDVLREQINIDGLPLHIVDTAGLRETDNPVELEGIKRAKAEIKKADLVLLMTADNVFPGNQSNNTDFPRKRSDEGISLITHFPRKRSDEGISSLTDFIPKEIPILIIKNKIDLSNEQPGLSKQGEYDVISLSAKTGDGINELKNYLEKKIGFEKNTQGVFMARRRHLDALNRAEQLLKKGLYQLQQEKAGELLAEDCRIAQLALCEITGEFTADDLLGKIFSEFCIGK